MSLSIDIVARVGALELAIELPSFAGTTVCVGPNGAGKSSLLLSLLGAIKPASGRIELDGEILFCSERRINVAIEDRRIGYVPQNYALFPHMTAGANVAFGARGRPAHGLLEDLGIDHLAGRKTQRLSGGESQRVALARALAIDPAALILDEPMAALDPTARRQVRRFLAERLAAIDIPTIVVSHDIEDAASLGDRIAVIEAGKITQLGTLDALRDQPATDFVAHFVS